MKTLKLADGLALPADQAVTQKQLCACGCGQLSPIASRTRPDKGHVQGQPTLLVQVHRAPAAVPRWRGADLVPQSQERPHPVTLTPNPQHCPHCWAQRATRVCGAIIAKRDSRYGIRRRRRCRVCGHRWTRYETNDDPRDTRHARPPSASR